MMRSRSLQRCSLSSSSSPAGLVFFFAQQWFAECNRRNRDTNRPKIFDCVHHLKQDFSPLRSSCHLKNSFAKLPARKGKKGQRNFDFVREKNYVAYFLFSWVAFLAFFSPFSSSLQCWPLPLHNSPLWRPQWLTPLHSQWSEREREERILEDWVITQLLAVEVPLRDYFQLRSLELRPTCGCCCLFDSSPPPTSPPESVEFHRKKLLLKLGRTKL